MIAATISAVSSTDRVVCVRTATFARGSRSRRVHVLDRRDEAHAVGGFAHGALDFFVALVADHQDRVALAAVAHRLDVDLRDERARCVDDREAALAARLPDRRRDSVRRIHRHGAGRDLVELVDEHRASAAQIAHHVLVVDDFLADVDWWPETVERALDDFDRAFHAGAEAPGACEVDLHGRRSDFSNLMTQTFRYGVLGAGMQGTAAGLRPRAARRGASRSSSSTATRRSRSRRGPRQRARRPRARRGAPPWTRATRTRSRARFAGLDGVLSAVPYQLNPGAARAAVRARACFNDLGGNTDVVREELALDRDARAAGISIVPDCGLAPGLGNILAAYLVSACPWANAIRIRCGGLTQTPRPPLGYKLVFNVGGLTNEYSGEAEYLRDGAIVRVPTLSEVESLEFPPPVGKAEAFVTSGGTSTAPTTFQGRLRDLRLQDGALPGPRREDPPPRGSRPARHEAGAGRRSAGRRRARSSTRSSCRGSRSPRIATSSCSASLAPASTRTGWSRGRSTSSTSTTRRPASARWSARRRFPPRPASISRSLKRVPPGAVPPEQAFTSKDYVEAVRARGLRLAESEA